MIETASCHDGFRTGVERALGASHRACADVGEVLATAARIADGDADAWLREWTAVAGEAWAAARAADDTGRRVSALAHYRRAANYYATALHLIAWTSEPDRRLDLWRRQRECWDRAVSRLPAPGERLAIPYERTSLPAYFFRAPDAAPGEARPLVVINQGSEDTTSHTWVLGGAAAAERGYHWMTFDGPGQQAALLEQHLPSRPDWEAVLTPVVDALVARPDVDADRMAVVGLMDGGYSVPRALAFEHRFAAAVVDPGVLDVSASWIAPLPLQMREQLRRRDQHGFERDMHLAELFAPGITALLRIRGAPYGFDGGSPYRLYEHLRAYRLGDEVARISTPLLVTDPEDEQRWPGQSHRLYDHLPEPKQLVPLSSEGSALRHREPLAPAQRDSRIFDWLDRYLG